MTKAFHAAHPRARAQASSSSPIASRNVARDLPRKNVKAMTRFAEAMSPWNHTPGPVQVLLTASCQTASSPGRSTS